MVLNYMPNPEQREVADVDDLYALIDKIEATKEAVKRQIEDARNGISPYEAAQIETKLSAMGLSRYKPYRVDDAKVQEWRRRVGWREHSLGGYRDKPFFIIRFHEKVEGALILDWRDEVGCVALPEHLTEFHDKYQ